jgi:putative intracellular protease/amidase
MTGACRHEQDVLRAAAEDRWTETLRRHLTECDECVATAAAAPWMSRFARISDREHILPDPSVVWLKAKLLQGTVDAVRVARPLDMAQIFAYIVVAGGWAGLLTWRWDAVAAWLRSFTPSGLVTTAAAVSGSGSLSMSFFAMVFVLASMTVMLALHTILAEE